MTFSEPQITAASEDKQGKPRKERKRQLRGTNESREETKRINQLQKRHPGTRRQRSAHGANRYSVQFFDRRTGKLVADYNL